MTNFTFKAMQAAFTGSTPFSSSFMGGIFICQLMQSPLYTTEC